MSGDILNIYHFTGARWKRYSIYKQVLGTRNLERFEYAVIDHLDMDTSHYLECRDGRKLLDCEIIQSIDAKFEERPRS